MVFRVVTLVIRAIDLLKSTAMCFFRVVDQNSADCMFVFRAVAYLESLEMMPDTQAMWMSLSRTALVNQQLHVAERCFAALGDISKARYLKETNRMAAALTKQTVSTFSLHHHHHHHIK